MNEISEVDYGPLASLIGVWQGDKGMDIAPDPDGQEHNPYYESIDYSAVGDVTNAESQTLSVIHYRQIVRHKSDDQVFHDQAGYWMWDSERQLLMHSLIIPRGVCVLAGGQYHGNQAPAGEILIEVQAEVDNPNWTIIQSPFMQGNARTTAFRQSITVGNGKLFYAQTTMVDIYGKVFEHTDQNELIIST